MEDNEQLKNLMKQNLELLHDLEVDVRKIKNYLFWQRVGTVIKVLLILIPIALAIIYLPPIIKNALGQYYGLIGGLKSGAMPSGILNILGK
ncbi:hypothetical protein HY932_03045 [Candidatus Falkowbacteria bacterium]|nr:hypothetical protein [Candidatus Falkowbacteria bacterium]